MSDHKPDYADPARKVQADAWETVAAAYGT